MPPQVNARLTRVQGATVATGGRDDWDAPAVEPGDAGAEKWAGVADAYYRETHDRRPDGRVLVRELILDTATVTAAGIDTDDVLTFTDPAGVERTARAAIVAIRELAGVPAELQTARLELEVL